jgi:DNA repair exonuclease SbcCD ATPase subunit
MITGVSARNFLSWKTLDREIPTGVTLIDGWNEDDQTSEGSGKSGILNAICWTVYGKIPKDANIDDVIKEGERSCAGEVRFSDGSLIRRTRGPNELLMSIGGKIVKGKDARETQTLIEEFVGLSFETFCQTIYFAQNYTKKFVTSNQEEKGKILSEVQDLTVFDKAGKEVRALLKLEEDSMTKLKHSKDLAQKDRDLTEKDVAAQKLRYDHALQQQTQRIASLTAQIQSEEMKREHLAQQQATRQANLQNQIAESQRSYLEQDAAKAELMAAVATMVYDEALEKSYAEANNALVAQGGAITAEITGIDKEITRRAQVKASLDRYVARYKQVATEKQKNLDFIANPSKDCPTCGTKLQACDTSHATTELTRLDAELVEITAALTQLDGELQAPAPTKDELNQKLNDIRQQRMTNDGEINKLRAIKDQMNRAGAHLSGFDRTMAGITTKITQLQLTLAAESQPLVIDEKPLEALSNALAFESQPLTFDAGPLEALQAKLEGIASNLINFDNLIAENVAHTRRLEDLKTGFKEIKSFVFNSMLNEINARVQKYLSHLFEVPVSVRFRNEDMKIETDVKYDGVDRGLGLLSGGQFRRVSLAIDLALSDVVTSRKGSRMGVLILDEYFKDLSETSMEKCLTLLEGRGQPVLLIEHNSIFKNIVNNSIMVRLEDGTSSVQA